MPFSTMKRSVDCEHQGFYSGEGRYSMEAEELRYVLICDDCGEEMQQISSERYVPNPALGPI
jgi:hypothetical protein